MTNIVDLQKADDLNTLGVKKAINEVVGLREGRITPRFWHRMIDR